MYVVDHKIDKFGTAEMKAIEDESSSTGQICHRITFLHRRPYLAASVLCVAADALVGGSGFNGNRSSG